MTVAVNALTPVGRIGRYDILGRLATGGMAEIFLARETGPHAASRELVVKRVLSHVAGDERLKQMFLQEARLCMRLRHTNICPIFEFGEQDGALFLAMEWVHGASLARVIQRVTDRGGHLPVALSVRVVAEVAGALHHAHTARDASGHAMDIVHRDVTPENIMLGYDGVSRLLDFGIAKAATQHDKTQAGELKGKFAYMSPEQYQGEAVDGRSDIFSLGVCLFEALTGESLYARQSEYETVAAIVLETDIPSIRDLRPELPAALDAIVQTALAKRREDRFQDADAMQASLELYLADTSQVVRDAEVRTYVRKLFADEVDSVPALDRTPLAPASADVTGAQPLDEIQRLAIGVEVDDAEAQFATAGRRKRLGIGLLVALVVLAILGVLGLALREGPPRGGHEGAPDPGTVQP